MLESLDEAVSGVDTAPKPQDAPPPAIKVDAVPVPPAPKMKADPVPVPPSAPAPKAAVDAAPVTPSPPPSPVAPAPKVDAVAVPPVATAARMKIDPIAVSPVSATPEIKLGPADPLRFATAQGNEKIPARKDASFFGRVLGFTTRLAVVACLCAAAWAAGAYYHDYYPSGRSLLDFLKPSQISSQTSNQISGPQGQQQSADRDDISRAIAQMSDDIRALKASVEGRAVAQNDNVANSAKNQPDAAQTSTSAALADLASRLDKLEADSATKLARINEQLATIEQQLASAAPRPAPPAPRKRVEHPHDAFDPTKDPLAPGAPRPLNR